MTDDQREPDQLEGVPLPEFQRVVVGHAPVLGEIVSKLERKRLPGGLLLHGPRGIGKATVAFELARRIFMATGDETPEHIVEQVASGGYPNLVVLRKAPRDAGRGYYTEIRVGEIRAAIEELRLTRGRAGHRVAIVDPIDDANANSANALLKILEEPPPDTTFILVSHRPGQLLPTIRSRCHSVALRPLASPEVREVLAANSPEAQAADIDRAVALAGGIPRRGFEALLLGDTSALTALRAWLADPASPRSGAHLALGDALSGRDSAEARFARVLLYDWMSEEARTAAVTGDRARLASASELWEKAGALFVDTDEYNLDQRQTLVSVFDGIKRHAQAHLVATELE